MDKKELKEEDLNKIVGGDDDEDRPYHWVRYHNDCGGVITGAGNLFSSCVCQRCGASSYFLSGFPGGYVTVREFEDE